jgi:small neutral amino acid transporter SnatA (MarC family)
VTRADDPVLVTTAGKSPRQEQRERERRYLVTMAARVVCFILAIVLFGVGLRWIAAFAVAGSLILPWVAVVAANAGPRRTEERPALYARKPPNQLPPGR